MLAITQPTELGTVYTLDEMRALAELCKEESLLLHIDGARIFNALAYLGITLSELLNHIPIDTMYLGGAKNGAMNAEALLVFNPDLFEGGDYIHKQSLQLTSKMRYLAAQFIPLFENDLGYELARHANAQAKKLAQVIESLEGIQIVAPVESNQLFFQAPNMVKKIQEKITCYTWNIEQDQLRFITSWCTRDEDIVQVSDYLIA